MKVSNKYFEIDGNIYFFEDIEKLPNAKENALIMYIAMICRSWTFGRLTDVEKNRCINALIESERAALRGGFLTRWEILNAIYHAILDALGYEPIGWRENSEAV